MRPQILVRKDGKTSRINGLQDAKKVDGLAKRTPISHITYPTQTAVPPLGRGTKHTLGLARSALRDMRMKQYRFFDAIFLRFDCPGQAFEEWDGEDPDRGSAEGAPDEDHKELRQIVFHSRRERREIPGDPSCRGIAEEPGTHE